MKKLLHFLKINKINGCLLFLFVLIITVLICFAAWKVNDIIRFQTEENRDLSWQTDSLRAVIKDQNIYIRKILDWKDTLYSGSSQEIHKKIKEEKKRRLKKNE